MYRSLQEDGGVHLGPTTPARAPDGSRVPSTLDFHARSKEMNMSKTKKRRGRPPKHDHDFNRLQRSIPIEPQRVAKFILASPPRPK